MRTDRQREAAKRTGRHIAQSSALGKTVFNREFLAAGATGKLTARSRRWGAGNFYFYGHDVLILNIFLHSVNGPRM
jgi:hypothetical protein